MGNSNCEISVHYKVREEQTNKKQLCALRMMCKKKYKKVCKYKE